MKALIIEKTEDTPNVNFDLSNEKLEMSGRSMPENATEFYKPVLEWMNAYAEDPKETTVFDFKMEYFNTASSKIIMDILVILEEMQENGHEVIVHWNYMEGDDDMMDAGEEYAEIIEIPFKHVAYE